MMAITAVWLSFILACPSLAVLTNHTIDGAAALVRYTPSRGRLLIGSKEVTQVVEMNFTGSAIYIFLAANGAPPPSRQRCTFTLDDLDVGPSLPEEWPEWPKRYAAFAYSNDSLLDGPHTFHMRLLGNSRLSFAYAIFSSNDPESGRSPSLSTSATNRIRRHYSRTLEKRKLSVPAIAGGAVAGVAVLLVLISILMLLRRPRNGDSTRTSWTNVDPAPVPLLSGRGWTQPSFPEGVNDPDHHTAGLVLELRMLREQVERLEAERREGSGSAGSETASLTLSRSFSTMKREQTRVVQAHQYGYGVTDSLVHTDSGLRLTAGREVHEVPPTYVPE
ncbi:hypothetical protein DFH09DRAFT_1461880 [Mycena vulgaris]|nr:hypothetical protein DFH09DRAFT_1461880 [Mycena vulgaris]